MRVPGGTMAEALAANGGHSAGGPRVVELALDSLVSTGSPRSAGEDAAHVALLAEQPGVSLPPILVHRPTNRVIDGAHRVRAAQWRGDRTIRAVYFEGSDDDAFVVAVRANNAHGLPLPDRRAAARRILMNFPAWSDRAVAAVTGLAPGTVQSVRAQGGHQPPVAARVGRDGRVRPLDPAQGRRLAASVITSRPDASLREVARLAGVSVGTARDVRRRLRDGEEVVPRGARSAAAPSVAEVRTVSLGRGGSEARAGRSVTHHAAAAAKGRHDGAPAAGRHGAPSVGNDERGVFSVMQVLQQDPALRYSERGRQVLRWLGAHFVDPADCRQVAAEVPLHSSYSIIEVAQAYAAAWQSLADELTGRVRAGSGEREAAFE
ncbi:ParB-like nuclease domain-containing protein [Natronosporangium hydrolyticum]|uniref:ParB-like nuclease domain-containing protein n=1 Tax=Natronosporangium hydrolyticum TaxID=2811111 RepID=A0A895Y6D5_9ACTN|nr:ParB/RepB/Spo0J family partition protein [Natronosporangium hydrolyticum]QSB13294.1 ParB-like nuclease domain-containing protein [Natronosporangium hydrolyticum]